MKWLEDMLDDNENYRKEQEDREKEKLANENEEEKKILGLSQEAINKIITPKLRDAKKILATKASWSCKLDEERVTLGESGESVIAFVKFTLKSKREGMPFYIHLTALKNVAKISAIYNTGRIGEQKTEFVIDENLDNKFGDFIQKFFKEILKQ